MTSVDALTPGMSRGSKVGVVIVNWNAQSMLDRAMEALARQTVAPHQVVVVDNASSTFDASPSEPSNTRYVRLDYNSGFARGNNLAVALLDDCDWIALINPDAFLADNWIERMLATAAAEVEYAFFAGKTLIADEPSLLDGAGDNYHVSGIAWRRGYRHADSHASSRIEVFGPCAATAMYAKDAFDAVGGFDEDFFCYFEDVDLAFRLRLAGFRCLFVPDAIALHVGSGTTGGQHSDFAVYHGHRNVVWTYVKNMPGIWFWLFLIPHLAMNFAACLLYAMKGQARTIFRAKCDALRGLQRMLRKRTEVQRRRVARSADLLRVMNKSLLPSARRWPDRRAK